MAECLLSLLIITVSFDLPTPFPGALVDANPDHEIGTDHMEIKRSRELSVRLLRRKLWKHSQV